MNLRSSTTAFLIALAIGLSGPASAATPASPGKRATPALMLADIQQAIWIRDGKSAHVLYVFFDPNCPYCHKIYEALRPHVGRGEVELRWIPLGILMTTSPGKAAAILEAGDPSEAFHRNERSFSQETGNFGGIPEEPLPRDETVKTLERNHALLRRSGHDAVPSLLFRTRDGSARFIPGAPPINVLNQIVRDLE